MSTGWGGRVKRVSSFSLTQNKFSFQTDCLQASGPACVLQTFTEAAASGLRSNCGEGYCDFTNTGRTPRVHPSQRTQPLSSSWWKHCRGHGSAVLAPQQHRPTPGQRLKVHRWPLSRTATVPLEGPLTGTVHSRDANNWYTRCSEVKIKGLLKYKLTLLNYYFIFVTTS